MKTKLLVVLFLVSCGDGGPVEVKTVSPANGLASGGMKVTVTGSGFSDEAKVTVGGRPATVVKANPDSLEIIAPRGVAGPQPVVVSRGDYRSALDAGFTYEALTLTYVDVTPQQVNALPVDGAGATIADLDGDGKPELIQAARKEGVIVYPNLGGGKFGSARPIEPVVLKAPPDAGTGSADAGRVDAGMTVVDAGTPQPVFETPLDVRGVVTGDFDSDGKLDLFFCTASRGQSQVWKGLGGLMFAPLPYESQPQVFGIVQAAVAADLDGDADLDLLLTGTSTTAMGTAQVVMLMNDGRGRFTDVTERKLGVPAFDAPGVALGDLDGDGFMDLFFSGAMDVSRIYLGDGQGVFQRGAPDSLPNDAKPLGGWPALGDLDGDGTLDVFMPTAGQDRILFNDGTAHLDDVSTLFLGVESGASTRVQLVDLDLDGALDVLVLDLPGRVRMYRNDGSGRLFDYSFELVGNDATLLNAGLAVGDLDGDGDDDLFVSRIGYARPTLFFNLSPKKPVDTDGDQWPDSVDNCPAKPNPTQVSALSSPFGCKSGDACSKATGCELFGWGDSAYLFCRTAPLTQAQAQAKCRVLGGDLVQIDDAYENQALAAYGPGQAWIGISDQAVEGMWTWTNGALPTFTRWGVMQPDNAGTAGEDCATFNGETLLWNDDQCPLAKPYICEAPRAPEATDGDDCRTKPDGGM